MRSTPIHSHGGVLTSPLLAGSLMDRQIAIEDSSVRLGIQRYHQLAKQAVEDGQGAMLKPAERLLAYWFDAMRAAVAKEKRDIVRGRVGSGRHVYGELFAKVDAETTAAVTMQEVMSQCMQNSVSGVKMLELAYAVGRAVLAEHDLAHMRREHRAVYDALSLAYESPTPNIVTAWARKHGAENVPQYRRVCSHLGSRLIWMVIENCLLPDTKGGWVLCFHHKRKRIEGKKGAAFIVPDPAMIEAIDAGHAERQFMRPRYRPMLVPPYPWVYTEDQQGEKIVSGGYITIRTPLVSAPSRSQKRAYRSADLTKVFEHLSNLGQTPFAINKKMKAAMELVYDQGGGVGHCPLVGNMEMPPRPDVFPSEEADLAWRREAVEVRRVNLARAARREEFRAQMALAGEFENEDAIYFPHQLDFRGRSYPIPVHLNHQGNDVCRGLLHLGNGVDVDKRGQWWLNVHAANCWGHKVDKMGFSGRVEFSESKRREMIESARDPAGTTFWREAEKPWQFLAACMAIEDPEAAAHLPLQQDASCNGLQHYAALGRDLDGARSTNLVRGIQDVPADLYSDVLTIATAIVRADSINGEGVISLKRKAGIVTREIKTLASIILPFMARKIVKQPVMTSVYGVTRSGAKIQIGGQLAEVGFPKDDLSHASSYLAMVVERALAGVCRAASDLMAWIRRCARTIALAGHELAWTSPIGLPVVQDARIWRTVKIETILGCLTLATDDEDVPIDVRRQINSSAPNIVHSIDSSHMFMVTSACRKRGIDSAAIHDCFASHLAHGDEVGSIYRRTFVELHTTPILADILAGWRDMYPDLELPDLPPPGEFDIRDVLHAPYCVS
jgi:DNA-directed RNA polymerase, mitochondrial